MVFPILCSTLVEGYGTAPPAVSSTCIDLIPDSRAPHEKQHGSGSYDLTISGLISNDSYYKYSGGTVLTGEFHSQQIGC